MFANFQNSFIFGFSKKFAIKHLSRFPPHRNYVATLLCETWNATFSIYHYSCYKNLHRNLFSFLLNVIHIIWHLLPWHSSDSTVTACQVQNLLWVLYLPAKQCANSMSAHSLRVSVSHFRLLKWETTTFILSGVWLQYPESVPTELQNLNQNLAAGLQILHLYI